MKSSGKAAKSRNAAPAKSAHPAKRAAGGVQRASMPEGIRASRPHIPGYGIAGENEGRGLLPWSWAEQRLTKSWNYWVATSRADARPHVMPVWGVWRDGVFWFSTGDKTVKARNLAANPHCVICTERADDAVVLEGTAEWVPASAALLPLWHAYQKKYKWDMKDTGFYRVRPVIAFGLIEKGQLFTQTATRWTFA